MKTNFHTHHELCGHAGGHVIDYVLEAIKNDYSILGMSDHGPLYNAPFARMNLEDFKNIYLKEIKDCQEQFKNQIIIKSGLEIEYVEGNDSYYFDLLKSLDYLILGCHFYSGKPGYKDKSSYCVGTHEALEEYTELIEDALKTGAFRILAHPDLFMNGYPYFDSFAEACSRRIIEACKTHHVLIEFNANGIRKGKREMANGSIEYSYPNVHFWKIVQEMGAEVIIGSDCHNPKNLEDDAMKLAREMATELKLNLKYDI